MKDYASNRDSFVNQTVTGSYAKLLPQAIAIADRELLLPPPGRVAWVIVNISAVPPSNISSGNGAVPTVMISSNFGHPSTTGNKKIASENDTHVKNSAITTTNPPSGSPVEDYEIVDSAIIRDIEVDGGVAGGKSNAKPCLDNTKDNSPDSGVISMESMVNINLKTDYAHAASGATDSIVGQVVAMETTAVKNVSEIDPQTVGMPGDTFSSMISNTESSRKSSGCSDVINKVSNNGILNCNSQNGISSSTNAIVVGSSISRPHPYNSKEVDRSSFGDAASPFGMPSVTTLSSIPTAVSHSSGHPASIASATTLPSTTIQLLGTKCRNDPVVSTHFTGTGMERGPGSAETPPIRNNMRHLVPNLRSESSSLFGVLPEPLPLVAPPSASASPTMRRRKGSLSTDSYSHSVPTMSFATPVAPPSRNSSCTSYEAVQPVQPPAPRFSPAPSITTSAVSTPRINSVSDSTPTAVYPEVSLASSFSSVAKRMDAVITKSNTTSPSLLSSRHNCLSTDAADNQFSGTNNAVTELAIQGVKVTSSFRGGNEKVNSPLNDAIIHDIGTTNVESQTITPSEVILCREEYTRVESHTNNIVKLDVIKDHSLTLEAKPAKLSNGSTDDYLSGCESDFEGESGVERDAESNSSIQTDGFFNVSFSAAAASLDFMASEIAVTEIDRKNDYYISSQRVEERIVFEDIYHSSDGVISSENE